MTDASVGATVTEAEVAGGTVQGAENLAENLSPDAYLPRASTFHFVLRPFDAYDLARERGEVVDTASWRTTRVLISNRYLAPIPFDAEPPVTCECGRMWISAETADAHACPVRAPSPRLRGRAQKASA